MFNELNHEVILVAKPDGHFNLLRVRMRPWIEPANTMHQVVANTKGVGMLGLQAETATIADKWGVGPGSIAKKLMVQIGIVKPKRLWVAQNTGRCNLEFWLRLRREKIFLNQWSRRRKICSRDTKIDIEKIHDHKDKREVQSLQKSRISYLRSNQPNKNSFNRYWWIRRRNYNWRT